MNPIDHRHRHGDGEGRIPIGRKNLRTFEILYIYKIGKRIYIVIISLFVTVIHRRENRFFSSFSQNKRKKMYCSLKTIFFSQVFLA